MGKKNSYSYSSTNNQSAVPVAIYVRMSTDHQKYSIANQTDALLTYAKKHRMQVIKTYKDEGISGLTLRERKGLSKLLQDVIQEEAEFKAILVYDVSRWGRFQDTDESAYYEYTCKKAGIKVHYCAEQFDNDEKALSSIIKNLKRAMAAEYSRDLSKRVFAGLKRTARNGYLPGGTPGYGMRRLLIDQDGNPKQILEQGEHKNIRSDRVILVPGPENECKTVRQIFDWFAFDGLTTHEIAAKLNQDLSATGKSRPWQHATILHMLRNEKYIGHNVYNLKSSKMKGPQIMNPPEEWIRVKGAFEPIVSKTVFRKAQRIVKARRRSKSDEEMLSSLKKLYKRTGYLNISVIDKDKGTPTANTYINRFKSIYAAYTLVGFHHNSPGPSNIELLLKLKKLYKKHGYLTAGIIEKDPGVVGRDTYTRRFGSIRKAYELVGYKREKNRIPAKIMLKQLRLVLKEQGRLSDSIIKSSSLCPGAGVYRKVFGSLKTAYALIGYEYQHDPVPNDILIKYLEQLYEEHGYLTGPLIDNAPIPVTRQIYHGRFGNLKNAFALVGYSIHGNSLPDDILLKRLKELLTDKGYLSSSVINSHAATPCSHTYANRFGTLTRAYKLIGYEQKNNTRI